jgi:hypothetical protein
VLVTVSFDDFPYSKFSLLGIQDFISPCLAASYSTGAAPEVSFGGAPQDGQSTISGGTPDDVYVSHILCRING